MTAGGNSFKNATAHKVNSYYTLAISYCTFCVGKHTILGPAELLSLFYVERAKFGHTVYIYTVLDLYCSVARNPTGRRRPTLGRLAGRHACNASSCMQTGSMRSAADQ